MRTRSLLTWSCLGLLLGACGSEAGAARSDTTAAAAETRLVVVSTAAKEAVPTIAPELIEDCVGYVPFAAANGNFYMNAIWQIAEQNLDRLRVVCEEMGHTDPAGLQRISDAQEDLDRFFASLTSTPGAAIPTTAGPTSGAPTIPGAPGCPDGSVMTATGHCQAATP